MTRNELTYTGRLYYDLLKAVGYRHDKENNTVWSNRCVQVEMNRFGEEHGYLTEENWFKGGYEEYRKAVLFLKDKGLITLRNFTVPVERGFVSHRTAIKVNVMATETADKYIEAIEGRA